MPPVGCLIEEGHTLFEWNETPIGTGRNNVYEVKSHSLTLMIGYCKVLRSGIMTARLKS